MIDLEKDTMRAVWYKDTDLMNEANKETFEGYIRNARYLIENFSPFDWKSDLNAMEYIMIERSISGFLYLLDVKGDLNNHPTYKTNMVATMLRIEPGQLTSGAALPF